MSLRLLGGIRGLDELIGLKLISDIEMERNERRHGLQRLRIHVVDENHHCARIIRCLQGKALRAEVDDNSRFCRALGQLGVQQFVNLAQTRVRGVAPPPCSR